MDNHFHLLVRRHERTCRGSCSGFDGLRALRRVTDTTAPVTFFKAASRRSSSKTTFISCLDAVHPSRPDKNRLLPQLDRGERLRRLNAYPWSSYQGYIDAETPRSIAAMRCSRNTAAMRRRPKAVSGLRAGSVMEDAGRWWSARCQSLRDQKSSIVRRGRRSHRRAAPRSNEDHDLDLSRRTAWLAEIDAAVSRHTASSAMPWRTWSPGGTAKAVAVALAARLAEEGHRWIGEHYGVGP